MSNSIDSKVVELKFDNADFVSKVDDTLKSVNKLQESLKFDGITDNIADISKSVGGVDMSGLAESVDDIKNRFSILGEVIHTRVVSGINSAITGVENLVKSLTLDQINAGFTKFTDKTVSVQTIMSATGESIEYVGEMLDKLNWFTDETSYDFVDMTNNIGKFTSAGVDLEKSVSAMEGIAALASLSGQGKNEASRVMYNFSQALGSGTVRLQDWMSVENANMATKEFKETIIETAKEIGTLPQNTDVTFENFRDSLQNKWFTSDVLVKALEKYGGFTEALSEATDELGSGATETLRWLKEYREGLLDIDEVTQELGVDSDTLTGVLDRLNDPVYELGEKAFRAAQEAKTFEEAIDATKDAVSTGWMNSFEQIFGNYEEAKVLWTELAERMYTMFAEGGEYRNEILAAWKEGGGRDDLIEAVWNIWDIVQRVVDMVKEAWHNFFPQIDENNLLAFTSRLKEITEQAKNLEGYVTGWVGSDFYDKIQTVLNGISYSLYSAKETISAIFYVLEPVTWLFTDIVETVVELLGKIGVWSSDTENVESANEKLWSTAEKLRTVVADIVRVARSFLKWSKNEFAHLDEVIGTIKAKLEDIFGKIDLEPAKKKVEEFGQSLHGIVDKIDISTPVNKAKGAFSALFKKPTEEAEALGDALDESVTELAEPETAEGIQETAETIEDISEAISETNDNASGSSIVSFFNNMFHSAKETVTPVAELAEEQHTLAESIVESAYEIAEAQQNPAVALQQQEMYTQRLKTAFSEILTKAKAFGTHFAAIAAEIGSKVGTLANRLLTVVDNVVNKLKVSSLGKNIETTFTNIEKIATTLGIKFGELAKGISNSFLNFVKGIDTKKITDVFDSFFEGLKKADVAGLAKDIGEAFTTALAKGVEFFDTIAQKISGFIGSIDVDRVIEDFNAAKASIENSAVFKFFKDLVTFAFTSVNTIADVLDKLIVKLTGKTNEIDTEDTAQKIIDFFGKIKTAASAAKETLTTALASVKEFLAGLSESLSQSASDISGAQLLDKTLDLLISLVDAIAAGTLAAGIKGIADAFSGLKDIGEGLGDVLDGVTGVMKGAKKNLEAAAITQIALAILAIAGSIVLLASLDDAAQAQGAVDAITTIFAEIIALIAVVSKTAKGSKDIGENFEDISSSVLKFALAAIILSAAAAIIGKADAGALLTGFAFIATFMGIMFAVVKNLGGTQIDVQAGFIIAFAASMIILALALKMMADAASDNLAAFGLAAAMMALLMGIMGLFFENEKAISVSKTTSDAIAKEIIALAAAMLIMAIAVKALADIASEDLGIFWNAVGAFAAIAVVLAVMVGVLNLLASKEGISGNVTTVMTQLLLIVVTMMLIVPLIERLEGVSWDTLLKAGAILGGLLIALVALFAIGVLAGVMSEPLAKFFGIIDAFLITLDVTLLSIAAAIYVVAQSALAFAEAFALVVATAMLVKDNITELLPTILLLLDLIPYVGRKLGEGLYELMNALYENRDAVQIFLYTFGRMAMDLVFEFIIGIVDGILRELNRLVEGILVGIVDFLALLNEYSYELIDLLLKILINIMKAINENVDEIVVELIIFVVQVIEGLAIALEREGDRIWTAVFHVIEALWEFIKRGTILLLEWLLDIVMDGIIDLFGGAESETGKKIGDWWEGVKEFFKDPIGGFKKMGKDFLNSFINGFKEDFTKAKEAVTGLVDKIKGWFTGKDGLDINSPSGVTEEYGMYMDEGLVEGINKNSNQVSSAVRQLESRAIKAMGNSMKDISDEVDSSLDTEPVIRPVVDLSEVQSASDILGKIFGSGSSIMFSNTSSSVDTLKEAATLMEEKAKGLFGAKTDYDAVTNPGENNSLSFNNTFNITSSNPRESADRISEILQRQFERRDTVWA